MAHIKATNEEIREVMQRHIRESVSLDGACRECWAPTPVGMFAPNVGGSHWDVTLLPGTVPECHGVILTIVDAVMAEYELRI